MMKESSRKLKSNPLFPNNNNSNQSFKSFPSLTDDESKDRVKTQSNMRLDITDKKYISSGITNTQDNNIPYTRLLSYEIYAKDSSAGSKDQTMNIKDQSIHSKDQGISSRDQLSSRQNYEDKILPEIVKLNPLSSITHNRLTSLLSGSNSSYNLASHELRTADTATVKTENDIDPKDDAKKYLDRNKTALTTLIHRISKLSLRNQLPNYEPTKFSDKHHGIIKGFAVCTNQGLIRPYNEDRVAIILNIVKPPNKTHIENWPNCSFFGIYDGHGGDKCAEFLRNNLHQYVIRNKNFPWNAQEALKEAFDEIENAFTNLALKDTENGTHDRSGSCALILMIVNDICYIANVGDSRAIISQSSGTIMQPLTRDHKPCDKLEQKRIIEAGGKIYQRHPFGPAINKLNYDFSQLTLPLRVFPGRLSVSRTFGDIEAKLPKFGGINGVIISKPDIISFKITNDHDFILMGSDGIYDKLLNEDIIKQIWSCFNNKDSKDFHDLNRLAIEEIIKESLIKQSMDNVTAILISFASFETKYKEENKSMNKEINTENLNIMTKRPMSRRNQLKFNDFNSANLTRNMNSPINGNGISNVSSHQRILNTLKPTIDTQKLELAKTDNIKGVTHYNYKISNPHLLPPLGMRSPTDQKDIKLM